jgi:hypothetical protein
MPFPGSKKQPQSRHKIPATAVKHVLLCAVLNFPYKTALGSVAEPKNRDVQIFTIVVQAQV